MIRALIFAAGAAAGFVVGARSGRRAYETMKEQSLDVWHHPAVQKKVGGATQTVKDKAPELQRQVAALAKKATHRGPDTGSDTGTAPGIPPTEAVPDAPAVTEPTVPPATDGRSVSST
ncbi:YtxH domain-containing protein [Rhodococcus sp. 14C212]|uniref:YtxH domain-containing protein n=1 Tax=Rhodococcus sp. 14C212 TaxID=2711209 RepID=UPI0013EA4527|nr:YtxH domain-containing protein [Rhodococcus sp. 14C212]NGP08351.1 YtxH domain-containing protein [Rhodococcus sp. 14C212]